MIKIVCVLNLTSGNDVYGNLARENKTDHLAWLEHVILALSRRDLACRSQRTSQFRALRVLTSPDQVWSSALLSPAIEKKKKERKNSKRIWWQHSRDIGCLGELAGHCLRRWQLFPGQRGYFSHICSMFVFQLCRSCPVVCYCCLPTGTLISLGCGL